MMELMLLVVMFIPAVPRVMLVIWKSVGFLMLGGPGAGFFENINIRPRCGVGILYIYLQKFLFKYNIEYYSPTSPSSLFYSQRAGSRLSAAFGFSNSRLSCDSNSEHRNRA